jgi:hypothetical protein
MKSFWRTPFVFVSNNEYEVDGIYLGGRARLTAAGCSPISRRASERASCRCWSPEPCWGESSGAFVSIAAGVIDMCTPLALTARLLLTTPLHYRTWPGALNVLLPAA